MNRSDFFNPKGVWPRDEFAALFATIPADIAMPSDPFEAGDPEAIEAVNAFKAKLRNPEEVS